MKKKRLTCFALAMILCACTCTPAFATEQVEQGEPEEIIIPIHNNAEVREIEVSTQGITTVDAGDYTYEVEIIGTGSRTIPKDVTDYVYNRNYVSEGTWPTVQYSRGESTTISGSIEVASELMIPVIKAKVSASAGAAHEVVNTQTITYSIPYGYKGCIYYSLCLEYFSFRVTTKDLSGNVVSTDLGGCTGKEIKKDCGYNIRLIKIKL